MKRIRTLVPKGKKQRAIVVAAIIVGLCCGIFAVYHNKQTKTAVVVTYSTNKPSEEKPRNDFNWQGGPTDPKKLKIPSLGINAYVQNVGVDQNKQVAVPNNIYIAGWFVDTVRPGQKGLSVIDGHVDGVTQDKAVFANLDRAKMGSEINVEFGDGSTKSFTIMSTTETSTAEAPSVLFSQDPGVSNQLNLVTCSGNFDQKSNQYEKRIIVSARLK